MGLYDQIRERVFEQTGKRIHHTCYIAHVLDDHGLTRRIAHNRKGPDRRYRCPQALRPGIEEAIRHLGLLNAEQGTKTYWPPSLV